MRYTTCFCPNCGHYNAAAGVAVGKLMDKVSEQERWAMQMTGRIEDLMAVLERSLPTMRLEGAAMLSKSPTTSAALTDRAHSQEETDDA